MEEICQNLNANINTFQLIFHFCDNQGLINVEIHIESFLKKNNEISQMSLDLDIENASIGCMKIRKYWYSEIRKI